MSERCAKLPSKEARLQRTEAHGLRGALDGFVRLAEASLDPGTVTPCCSQVGIESKRTIDARCAFVEIPANIAEHVSAIGKSDCIVSS